MLVFNNWNTLIFIFSPQIFIVCLMRWFFGLWKCMTDKKMNRQNIYLIEYFISYEINVIWKPQLNDNKLFFWDICKIKFLVLFVRKIWYFFQICRNIIIEKDQEIYWKIESAIISNLGHLVVRKPGSFPVNPVHALVG